MTDTPEPELLKYTRLQLRQVLFGRRRTSPPFVVHSGRTTENRSTRTERRKAAKGYKAKQRIERYGRP